MRSLLYRLPLVRRYRILEAASPLIAIDDLEPDFLRAYERCRAFTMTSLPRMYALYQSVRHVVRNRVPGAFVECGVWRGGSAMLAALVFAALGDTERQLCLYDTFAGMTEPSEVDVDMRKTPASRRWRASQRGQVNEWCYASLEEVAGNMRSTGYPIDHIQLVKGRVEDTIPVSAPDRIAILRLDTDWYESTRHELTCLYPRLSVNGVLIVDDYGYWEGARKAVDEYVEREPLLLNRIDSTGRIGVKVVG